MDQERKKDELAWRCRAWMVFLDRFCLLICCSNTLICISRYPLCLVRCSSYCSTCRWYSGPSSPVTHASAAFQQHSEHCCVTVYHIKIASNKIFSIIYIVQIPKQVNFLTPPKEFHTQHSFHTNHIKRLMQHGHWPGGGCGGGGGGSTPSPITWGCMTGEEAWKGEGVRGLNCWLGGRPGKPGGNWPPISGGGPGGPAWDVVGAQPPSGPGILSR